MNDAPTQRLLGPGHSELALKALDALAQLFQRLESLRIRCQWICRIFLCQKRSERGPRVRRTGHTAHRASVNGRAEPTSGAD